VEYNGNAGSPPLSRLPVLVPEAHGVAVNESLRHEQAGTTRQSKMCPHRENRRVAPDLFLVFDSRVVADFLSTGVALFPTFVGRTHTYVWPRDFSVVMTNVAA
jgi:hypothetical protein